MLARELADAHEALRWARLRRFAPTAWGDIAYVECGRGPTALFLHGFPLSGFQWRGAIARLAEIRRCVAPDALGLGYTRVRPGRPVGFDAQVSMLLELMDVLQTGSVDIVANDSNTGVAQLLAAHHPHRVRSLLLTNGDTEPDSPPAALLPLIELGRAGQFADAVIAPHLADPHVARGPGGLATLAYTDPGHLTDAARRYHLAPLVADDRSKALVNAYAAALLPNPLDGLEPMLARISAPARVVWGMGDTFFSKDSAAYLDRVLPNSRGVRAIPQAKLFFPEEMPELIAEEARQLWAEAA